jgi:hypothetical protein
LLRISRAATAAIHVLSLRDVPERSGLRILRRARRDERRGLAAAVDRPAPDDEVIVATADDAHAALFVDADTAALVADQILDASGEKPPGFCLRPQRPRREIDRAEARARALPLLGRDARRARERERAQAPTP